MSDPITKEEGDYIYSSARRGMAFCPDCNDGGLARRSPIGSPSLNCICFNCGAGFDVVLSTRHIASPGLPGLRHQAYGRFVSGLRLTRGYAERTEGEPDG